MMTEAAAVADSAATGSALRGASLPKPRAGLWARFIDGVRLQHLLFVALTLVAAIPVLTLDIWESQASFQREVESVRERHLLVARNLTSTLSRYVLDLNAAFQIAFASGTLNPNTPGLPALLDSLDFVHVCVLAPDGSVEQFLPVQKAPEIAALTPRLIADLRALVANQRPGADSQPILSGLKRDPNGRPSFYLVKRLANNRLAVGEITTDYLVRLQSVIAFGERGHAVLVDANGLTIAHPFKDWAARMQDLSGVSTVKLMMARQTGVDTFFSPAFKDDMIAGYAFVPESGWGVMVPQPLSELKRRAREIDWVAWVVGGVALAIASVLSLLIARFLASPVRRVATTADAILAGNSDAKVPDFVGLVPQEIRRLGRAFNTMVDGVAQHVRNRVGQALDHGLVDFRAFAFHDQLDLFAGHVGHFARQTGHALEDRLHRLCADRHDAVLDFPGQQLKVFKSEGDVGRPRQTTFQHALGQHGLLDHQFANGVDEAVNAVEVDADGRLGHGGRSPASGCGGRCSGRWRWRGGLRRSCFRRHSSRGRFSRGFRRRILGL